MLFEKKFSCTQCHSKVDKFYFSRKIPCPAFPQSNSPFLIIHFGFIEFIPKKNKKQKKNHKNESASVYLMNENPEFISFKKSKQNLNHNERAFCVDVVSKTVYRQLEFKQKYRNRNSRKEIGENERRMRKRRGRMCISQHCEGFSML